MKHLRVRVEFEDRRMLSKAQRKQGLRRSWLLLRPEVDTVAALASHIIRSFDLHETCPTGLLLSMDQFVLPPFESTQIFKDKDVIGVRKRKFPLRETIKSSDDGNHIKDFEIIEKQPLLLCGNEEFENESGGYESEDVENAMVCQETSSDGKTGSKRKRNSSRPSSSRTKKMKKIRTDESPTVSLKIPLQINDAGKETSLTNNRPAKEISLPEEPKNMQKDVSATKEDKQMEGHERPPRESARLNGHVSDKKIPSRSARRKKAKRRWLRELKNSEGKEPARSDKEEDNALQKSPIHHEDEDISSDNEVIPVVVKPGHIRFGPSGPEEQPSHLSTETLKWNGTVNKKKGQKWGREEDWNVSAENDDTSVEKSNWEPVVQKENRSPDLLADFEKLPTLQRAPKKGDMIAYKLVELSSSWCPELSSFRVGKVTSFDPTSSKIVLDQVPGHPVSFHERTEEDGLLPDVSLYKDDGALEIEFPSLHDVRLFDNGNNSSGEVEWTESLKHEPNPANDNLTERVPGNAWEELGRALEEKKEELSQKGWASSDKKRPSKSGSIPWSLRALRRSAIGPTISLLRSNNDL